MVFFRSPARNGLYRKTRPPFQRSGQRVGEGDDMLVLRAFTYFAEARVVAVLLASFRVASRRLNVAIREGASPDFGQRV